MSGGRGVAPWRWWLIGVFALIGVGAAIVGAWWTTVSMAAVVAAQLASIAHQRRKEGERDRS